MNKFPRVLDCAFDLRDIPSSHKWLLICMAKLGNQTAQCFASQQTLAAMCGCSVRSIRRSQKYLRENGLITRIPDRTRTTDCYRLNFHKWMRDAGQSDRAMQTKRPVQRGQFVRQNQNRNLNMNQRGATSPKKRCFSSQSRDGKICFIDVLAGIEKGLVQQDRTQDSE